MRREDGFDEEFYGDDEWMDESPVEALTQRSRENSFEFNDMGEVEWDEFGFEEFEDVEDEQFEEEEFLIDLDDEDFSLDNRYSEETYTKTKVQKKPKQRRRGMKIFFVFFELICICVLSVAIYAADLYFTTQEDFNKNLVDQTFEVEKITKNEGVEKKLANGYTNIAVFGIDTRTTTFDSGVNSDTMIIVSINNETKEVKMVSVYRDSYLRTTTSSGAETYSKANSAYCMGGVEAAISMLNTNLDLDIENYVIINFKGVAKLIDAFGGIEVNLTEDEVTQLNYHLMDTRVSTGIYSDGVSEAGWQTLNGMQATTYCRLRGVTFYDEETGEAITDDFGRTARQRLVISKLVDKVKKAGVNKTLKIAKKLLKTKNDEDKIVTTSFTFQQIMDMIPILIEFNLSGSQGFPTAWKGASIGNSGSCLVPRGLAYNVTELHKFLFDEKDYEPTDAVYTINDIIVNITGVQPETVPTEDEESAESVQ